MNTILSPTADPKKSLRDTAFDLLGRFPIARWAPIPLRLIVGLGFMEHGFAKLSKGPDAFAAILHTLTVPAPHFTAWLTILTELLGGLAILLGAFVSLVSLPMAALLLVAIFTVHLPYGFSSIKLIAVTAAGARFGPPGYECDLLYLACLVALVFGGAGPLAIDGLLKKSRNAGHF
jgi:putative oxidoreductase